MRRILLSSILALAVLIAAVPATVRPAGAYELWCFDDPIIMVDGRLVDIRVNLPLLNLLSMRSTTLTVVIPQNVSGYVVLDDISAFPMTTIISPTGPVWNRQGPLPITVIANVKSTRQFSIQVVATPLLNLDTPLAAPVTKNGKSNTPLQMPMTLGR